MASCPVRARVRRNTLGALSKTDWGEAPTVCLEDPRWTIPLHRHMSLFRSTLEAARRSDGELFLLLEDDLLFNRFLRHNLEAWEPIRALRCDMHFFASIFNPGVVIRKVDGQRNWAEAEPLSVFGSQGLVISRRTVEYLVTCWGVVSVTHADIKLARLAALVCPILYHQPSLVQHVGFNSLWGGPFTAASDFDPRWTASRPELPHRGQILELESQRFGQRHAATIA